MKKYIVCTVFLTILSACAGNPPAWWNPSGRYSTSPQRSSSVSTSEEISKDSVSVPTQETLLPPDTDYEEMALSPIAAEEEISETTDLAPSILGE